MKHISDVAFTYIWSVAIIEGIKLLQRLVLQKL